MTIVFQGKRYPDEMTTADLKAFLRSETAGRTREERRQRFWVGDIVSKLTRRHAGKPGLLR